MRLATVLLVVFFVALSSVASAQEAELKLEAFGGATLKVPAAWKETRKEAGLIIREQAAEPSAQKPFIVALASIEEGPPLSPADAAGQVVPWETVRANMVKAASKNGRVVSLRVDEAALVVPGFEARRLHGDLTSPAPTSAPAGTAPRKVAIELIALVKDAKLVSIGVITETSATTLAREQALAIAKTAKLGL